MKYNLILFLFSFHFLTAQNIPLFVGTYTGENSEGIYSFDFNTQTGELTNKKLAVKTENPSFLTFSADKRILYAVSEASEGSSVSAFTVNKNKTLNFLNKVSSNGNGPCHVQLNKKGNLAVVSNYGGGTVSIYDINKNGSLNEAFQVINHNTETLKSHAHSAKFLKNNLFVADLGRGFLAQYVEKNNKFVLKENFNMKPKAGPRHFEISKKGNFIYVINELNSTVTVLKKQHKNYSNIQNISTLSDDFTGESFCADIHLSKNEEFLYGSNRGENSIVVYKRDKKSGMLKKIQNISVNGNWPRNFTLSPNGKFLLVANQKSNNISIYKVAKKSGKLSFINSLETGTPVCLLF
ncbi:lactonase family protein [Lutibacter flavus]|uniref:6-phosphogluconolactonase n=1 Tax=Lutibacter flavus TaxID=691689 RepID=A0A238X1R3_9FLAO|nr:lactonase family protein [Lutibacter flavus]SNR52374.1 6-phosphogluconolactonase [Lutibacter flavus]